MGSHLHLLRQARWLALGGWVALQGLLGCGETRRNGDTTVGAAGAVTSAGGSSGKVPPVGGGAAATGGGAPGDVRVGPCVFDDPNVAQLVRYQILQADKLDGPVDGSVGIESVTKLDVTQPLGALGGIECLVNLEELRLGVYDPEAPRVELSPLAGLSRLRALWLYGPFVLDGMFGQLALETLDVTGVPLNDLAEIGKETELRELWLTRVPLTSLAGIESLPRLSKLRIEEAPLTSLAALGSTAGLADLELRELPALTSLQGVEPHTSLRSLLTTNVPLDSLLPLANAERLESLNVWTSSLTTLVGLENKPSLSSVSVTDGHVKDIEPLGGLAQLSYLSLTGNQIADLAPLARQSKLTFLDASKNNIGSLAPIASLTSLRTLVISSNALTAIDVDLPDSLTSLDIASNAITSIEPLRTRALESLNISSNPLVSLAPLLDLPALVSLTANDVGATDLAAFPLAKLRYLVVNDNDISSVAPLSGLTDLSVDLTGNEVVSLPSDFLGLHSACGGLVLEGNPLDEDARERLQLLCDQGGGSYFWDGGACDKCPRV